MSINMNAGVWFQSTASGMWYDNPYAAGEISAVRVDGVQFARLGKRIWQHDGKKQQPVFAEVDAEAAATPKRFVKPTEQELALYFGKIGVPLTEVGAFIDHYNSNGWRVGATAMKDWQAAARNWKRNWEKRRYEGNGGSRPQRDANAGTYNEGKSYGFDTLVVRAKPAQ